MSSYYGTWIPARRRTPAPFLSPFAGGGPNTATYAQPASPAAPAPPAVAAAPQDPGVPPAAPPPAIPNINTILGGDPVFQQFLASLNAAGVQSAAQRDAAAQRAIAQFGGTPSFANIPGGSSLLSGINLGDAQQLAARNTTAGLSTVARLQQADQDAVRGINNSLAARGMFRSGETGFQLGRENQNYTQAQYDATQKLVDYLSGVQSAYTQAEQARQQAQYQAQQTALGNWLNLNPTFGAPPPGAAPPAPPPPGPPQPPAPPPPVPVVSGRPYVPFNRTSYQNPYVGGGMRPVPV